MHHEKKIQEIKEAFCNYSLKPITIIQGASGIGKLHSCKAILAELHYEVLEVDSVFRDVWMLNKVHPLLYSMQDQLSKLDDQKVIILKEFSEIQNINSLRKIQQQYTFIRCSKPLIIIVNTTVIKDYELAKILSYEFLKKYCYVILMRSPTKTKIEKYLQNAFPRISNRILSQIAELSNGDIRNAYNQALIFSLNYREETQSKDFQITFFNSVGRVLYNKRLNQSNIPKQLTYEEMIQKPEPKYYFNPLQLVETIQVTQQTFRGFLFINSLKFMHDIKEMNKFYEIQCQADVLEKSLCRFDRYQGDSLNNQFLISYMTTLGYMQTNKHVKPEKSTMLTLNGPQDYQFRQQRAIKQLELRQIKPFKSYQKDLVYQILFKKRYSSFNDKYSFSKNISQDEELLDQSWFEDIEIDNEQQKISVKNKQLKIKIKQNQKDLILRNYKSQYIDTNKKELQS